ncbi:MULTISPECIES: MFS transporter [Raoultella]|jgi:MHS family proline/betaine transporter-like MFS transporter|uniref:MHS family MFS transporter n=2 Tax=Raoultella planticola TaxID=575 RepID=A0A485ASW4_RAOPL|nr:MULTISPECIES: MFS transporter [Raoultella]AUU04290.1 metabolite-proton symporter [Raoultella planticola]AUV55451.1 MFS transporter [Raoultella planticola]EKW3529528.1 MFS transporter [Raoultella planticola]ELC3572632.1 MFS transporter [Raoultella planticola]ELF4971010.1 MFS transporter [Raoultella planticola]
MQTVTTTMGAHKRALIAGSIGNFIEWYEFAVYGFLATVIARNFFQLAGEAPLTGLILTYASFAIAFFFRPLGAIIFGRIGDRIGRKPTLIIVLVMMTLATTAIGLVPVYASIGIAAPLILTGLRILQGLFAGGEYGGAVSLMTEFAPRGKRGLYGAWQSFTVALGLLAGAGIVALISAVLSPEELYAWGWRLPFFLAIPMGGVALWLRVKMEETPGFLRQQKQQQPQASANLSHTLKAIMTGIGRLMVWSAAGYTYLVIMPAYLQSSLHTGFNQALLIAVISNIGFAITILPAGILSDKWGRRNVMVIAAVLLLILALPLLKILQAESSTLLVKALVVLVAGGLVGMLAGPGPAMLSEMFPTKVRYTGLGLAYSLSNAIFSGCAGLIITGLIKQTGNLDIPAYYVMATAVVSIFALMTLKKNDHLRSLDE